ncbi:hypothetical protein F8388_020649 [Cannabis sativa]|uniref:Uncharacterized protein n=1 Tax=Cannabis sativa TaxID=3483 RepID=A0A7J6F2P4_CANSA|nr:hypothetical protein F8388_020649 [Cannabis sativa]
MEGPAEKLSRWKLGALLTSRRGRESVTFLLPAANGCEWAMGNYAVITGEENGPRDWSSIRSKGLLPRTGKSCRLRWVNKLRPDLKTGCKFSAEEERLIIELQAQVGNKWAKIATYLPGRTDNDVRISGVDSSPESSPSYQSNCSHVEPEELRMVVAPLPEMMKPNIIKLDSELSMVDDGGIIDSCFINDPSVLIRESKSSNFFDDLTQDMLDYFDSVSDP